MSTMMGGYAAPAPPVDREVTGILQGFENRNNGWVRFAILEPNMQYPVKCDTKKQDVVAQAMAMGGQMVTVQIREQLSETLNPHTNQPYTNRYLNAIAPAGYAPSVQPQQPQWNGQQQVPPPQPQGQQWAPQQPQQPQAPPEQPRAFADNSGKTGAEKDLDIHRQLCWKGACWLAAAGKIEATPVALVQACEVGMAYLEYGPLRFGVQPFSSEQAAQMTQAFGGDGHPFNDALPPGAGAPEHEGQPGQACPDCGYVGGHAYGCPREGT